LTLLTPPDHHGQQLAYNFFEAARDIPTPLAGTTSSRSTSSSAGTSGGTSGSGSGSRSGGSSRGSSGYSSAGSSGGSSGSASSHPAWHNAVYTFALGSRACRVITPGSQVRQYQGDFNKLVFDGHCLGKALDCFSSKCAAWHSWQQALHAKQLAVHTQLDALQSETAGERSINAGQQIKLQPKQQVAELQNELRRLDKAVAKSAATRPTAPVDQLRALSDTLRVCGKVLTRETCTLS
jgi:hypothetical protein